MHFRSALFCAILSLSLTPQAFALKPAPIPERKPIAVQTTPKVTTENLVISKAGDVEMSCGALSKEAVTMRNIIHEMEEVKNGSEIQSHGVTAAGAVGSFLIGSVTGGIGLAVGGFLLDRNISANKDDADEIQDIAKQRRTLMMGIYNAKSCFGPLEHAMQNPEERDAMDIIADIQPASGQTYQTELRRRYND